MTEVSDITVYQKLSQIADELDELAAKGATIVGEAALMTAAKTVRGMASAVYRRIMADRDDGLDG